MTEDKVSTPHAKYSELAPKRQAFAVVKGGTDAIQKAEKAYLPEYPAEDSSDYKSRLSRATIDGIVSGGVETLTGTFFEGEIDTKKVHPSIVPLLENIDNCGNNLNVFARRAIDASFDGHSVIVVDMAMETEDSKAITQTYGAESDKILNRRPYWVLYKADDVINWRYRENPVTKIRELSLLVVKVIECVPVGQFGSKDVTRYRVWMLGEGNVIWQLWEEESEKKEAVMIASGTIAITRIAAAVLGELTDEPKLLVESRLEIKAYQKESSFDTIEYMSIPTLCIVGRQDTETQLALGASEVIDVPIEGDVKYVQIDSAGHESLKGTIREIKDFIKSRLNYIVSQAMPGEKTATEVVTEDKDKQARLLVWADQAKDAIELALSFTAEFMALGIDKGGEIVFNTKWMVAEQKQKEADERNAKQADADIKATTAKANGGH